MKKRMLAWLLVVAMMLGQVPVSAFAVEKETTPVTGEQSATEPAKATEVKSTEPTKATEAKSTEPTKAGEKSTEPTKAGEEAKSTDPTGATEETGATEPSEGTGETGAPTEETGAPTEETTAPTEETTEPTEAVNEAVAAVEGAIAALPALDVLETLDEAAQNAAYEQAQSIADAYDALTEEQQGKVANFETLVAFLNWFAVPEAMGINDVAQVEGLNFAHATFDGAYGHRDARTITLLQDATYSAEVYSAIGLSYAVLKKDLTIKLDNHKLTGYVGTSMSSIAVEKNVTFQGPGTVCPNDDNSLFQIFYYSLILKGGTLTLKDEVHIDRVYDEYAGGSIYVENAQISSLGVSYGTALTVSGGNITKLTVGDDMIEGSNATVTLKGGSFGTITRKGSAPTFSAMLAEGYVFFDASNKIVDISNTSLTTLSNVHVGKCTHGDWTEKDGNIFCDYCGYICYHSGVTESNRTCGTCSMVCNLKTEWSNGTTNTTKWYTSFGTFVNNWDCFVYAMTFYQDEAFTQLEVPWNNLTLNLNGHTLTTIGNTVTDGTLIVSGGTLAGNITATEGGHIYIKSNTTITGLVTFCDYESGEDCLEAGVTLQGGVKTTAPDQHLSDYLAEGTAFTQGDKVVDATDKTELTGEVKVVNHTHNCNTASGKCACGFECTTHTFDSLTGKCKTCQKDIAVATVTTTASGTAVTNYYQSFPEAYGAMADSSDTLTLLQDVSMSNNDWGSKVGTFLQKSFTFDLNGHSCGISDANTPINFAGKVTVKNGTFPYLLVMNKGEVVLDGVKSTTVACSDNTSLTVQENCDITNLNYSGGKLKVKGGKIGKLTASYDGIGVILSGGSFGEITMPGASNCDVSDLLSGGYVYRKNTETDNSYVKWSELEEVTTLQNVTVTTCPHNSFGTMDEYDIVQCEYCGNQCQHISGVDSEGKCNACHNQMEVEVTTSKAGSQSTYYWPKLTGALNWVNAGDTVKLLKDVTVTEIITSNANVILDLNGKTLDLGINTLIFKTTATLKNGTVKGDVTAKPAPDVEDMVLTVDSVTLQNGKLTVDGQEKSLSVTVKGGSLDELYVEGSVKAVQLYGGSYGKITTMLIPVKSFLPAGYGYQQSDAFILLPDGSTLENVTVAQCTTHGAPTDDASCGYCGTKLEASVTVNGTTTYCKTFKEALNYVNQSSGATLKLLADTKLTSSLPIQKNCTLDLNGKKLMGSSSYRSVCVNDGTTTIRNSGDASDFKIFLEGENAVVCVESGYVSEIDFGFNGGKAEINGGTVQKVTADQMYAPLAVTITGGQVDKLTVENPKCKVSISGGTFKEVIAPTGSTVGSLLKDGYAFYGGTDYTQLVNGAVKELSGSYQVKSHTHGDYVNGTCPCGYNCPHTNVDENNKCSECMLTFVAQLWRDGKQVGWLTRITDELGFISGGGPIEDGDTIKLMQGYQTAITINKAVVLDLNHYNCGTITVESTGATILDSTVTQEGVAGAMVSELNVQEAVTLGKGTWYGKITVNDGKSITIPDGYGFYQSGEYAGIYTYLSDSAASGMADVVVLKNPTDDWTITFKDEEGNAVKADELVYGKTYFATANPGTYVPTTATKAYSWNYDDTVLESLGANPSAPQTFKFTCRQAGATFLGCEITINGYKVTASVDNFTIQKADIPANYYTAPKANTLFYKGIDQKLVTAGTVDETKFTGHMEYKLEGGEWSKEIPKKMDKGEYKVYWRIVSGNAAYKNYEPKDPITVTITNDWQPKEGTEFTLNYVPNAEGWVPHSPTITAKEGYQVSCGNTEETAEWRDSLIEINTNFTFYVKDTKTGAISLPVTYLFKVDFNQNEFKTIATVSFSNGSSWDGFTDAADITFGLLFNQAVTVTVKAKDLGSGVATIEYAESDKALTLEQVKDLKNWSVMSTAEGEDDNDNIIGTKTVAAENGKQFVCYIRITDAVGNVTYLSTNGATFDTVAPTITGVTDGEMAYTTRVVQITDKHPGTVTLDGEPKTLTDGKLTLPGNVEKTYTIVATDKVGNATTLTVKMLPISSITADLDDLTVDNVNSGHGSKVRSAKDRINKELDNKNATPDEKAALNKELDKVNALLKRLEDVEKACNTDNIQKVKDITADNVKLEDKTNLEKAKADLNTALKDYEKNLTEAEKKTLNDKLNTIDKALKAIENVENVEKLIGDLPKTITSKDSKAVKAAEDAYNALTDHEKELVSSTSLKKLQAARKTLNRLNGDPTSPNTGDESHVTLWFTTLILSAAALVLLKKRKVVS